LREFFLRGLRGLCGSKAARASDERPLPTEKFAQGFGQFGQAEMGKIVGDPPDEFEVARRKGASGELDTLMNYGFAFGCPLYDTHAWREYSAKMQLLGKPMARSSD